MVGPTDPAEAYFDKGLWGWDLSQWRKLAMLWGYSDRYATQQQNTSDVNGVYTINLSSVPSGEVWCINGLAVYRDTTVGSFARVQLYDGAAAISIEDIAVAAAGTFYPNAREFVLKAGDNIRVAYVSSVVGEVVITVAFGYKMSISE